MMNKGAKIEIILLIMIMGNLCLNASAQKKPALGQLSLERTFPLETGDLFLSNPTGMQIDEENNILVIDQKLSAIFKFDSVGNFIRQLGRYGQGPNEFQMPNSFAYDAGRLYIVDDGNRRVQILDTAGRHLSSFKTYRSLAGIACLNGFIVAQQNFMPNEWDKFRLLSIIDQKGRVVKSFGESINNVIKIGRLPTDASFADIRVFQGKIFILFRYYPILQVYSKNGDLLETHRLALEQLAPNNYSPKSVLAKPGRINLRFIFLAFDVNEDGYFICLYKNNLEIIHFDFNGTCLNRYLYKDPGGDQIYLRDLYVSRRSNGYLFQVLEVLPNPRIEAFASNPSKSK